MSREKAAWFRPGLRFTCTGCGDCCRWPGYVWVDLPAMERLAGFLGLQLAQFSRKYVRAVGPKFSLTEKQSGDCIFYDQGCTVYEARPTQCRTYPFWPEQIESPEAWAEATEDCPGAGKGRLYRIGEVRRLARGEGETD